MSAAGFSALLLGIILLICYPIGKRKNKRCSAQSEGTLEKIKERYNSDGSLPSMYVYSYKVDGKEYQIQSTAYNSKVNRVGDHCTVWYNPSKPSEAQPFRYSSNKAYTIILIVGIVLVLLGFVLFAVGSAAPGLNK